MSAVILAVIVVMWAVVLVPMWLRRHDAATESRSVDRFSTAMRVLSRRSAAGPDRRYVLMPRRDTSAAVHVSGASSHARRPAAPPATVPGATAPVRPKQRASLAVRRRRVLLALGGVTLLTFILMVAGVLGWPLQLVVDLVLVAFVVHLRTQAKRSAVASRQRRRAAAASAPRTAARPAAPRRAPAADFTPAPSYAPAPAPSYAAAVAEPAYVDQPVEAVEAAATGTDDATAAWDPVPVPPPTYTMKPPAPPRYYPLVQPDSDAGLVDGGVGDEAVAARVEPEAGVGDDGQLDEILTHRWAVND